VRDLHRARTYAVLAARPCGDTSNESLAVMLSSSSP